MTPRSEFTCHPSQPVTSPYLSPSTVLTRGVSSPTVAPTGETAICLAASGMWSPEIHVSDDCVTWRILGNDARRAACRPFGCWTPTMGREKIPGNMIYILFVWHCQINEHGEPVFITFLYLHVSYSEGEIIWIINISYYPDWVLPISVSLFLAFLFCFVFCFSITSLSWKEYCIYTTVHVLGTAFMAYNYSTRTRYCIYGL